jgi:hypothetical protein
MAKSKSKSPPPQILFIDKSIDQLVTPCLVLPFCADEKPLKGIAGLVDWRLNGQISRQLLSQRVKGTSEETILIPLFSRIPAENILLLGLGEKESVNASSYQAALSHLLRTLSKARVGQFVFALNALISPTDQSLWISEFLLESQGKNNSFDPLTKAWTLLGSGRDLTACTEMIQERFSPKVHCLLDMVALEETARKPFGLR